MLAACQVNSNIPVKTNLHQPLLRQQSQSPSTETSLLAMPTFTPQITITHAATVPPPQTQRITLMAVGDIMLGRTIGDLIQSAGDEAPFRNVSAIISSADIAIGNLECTISTRGEPENKTYTFRAPLEAAHSLRSAGFDLLNLANNHILDYGQEAFFDTMQALSEQDIAYIGAGSAVSARAPHLVEINGLNLAFLGYFDIPIGAYDYTQWQAVGARPGIAWGFHHYISEDVKRARLEADIVVVMMHFGNEYAEVVSQAQIDSAHAAIDAGAALVIGSHPHLLQSLEEYNEGLIAYSLGNFVFDQFYDKANQTAILRVDISPAGIDSYELVPAQIQSNGTPMLIP